jgi:hypothetical protein
MPPAAKNNLPAKSTRAYNDRDSSILTQSPHRQAKKSRRNRKAERFCGFYIPLSYGLSERLDRFGYIT